MRYRIVYRDGMIGAPYPWEGVLFWVKHTRTLPYVLQPVRVIPAEMAR